MPEFNVSKGYSNLLNEYNKFTAEDLDNIFDVIPGVSTLTNLVELCAKAVFFFKKLDPENPSAWRQHLENKSVMRCVAGLFPALLPIYDACSGGKRSDAYYHWVDNKDRLKNEEEEAQMAFLLHDPRDMKDFLQYAGRGTQTELISLNPVLIQFCTKDQALEFASGFILLYKDIDSEEGQNEGAFSKKEFAAALKQGIDKHEDREELLEAYSEIINSKTKENDL